MNVQSLDSRPDLLAKYGGAAPRYTSYPTAVQFTPAYDAAAHGRALAALDPAEAVSLYLHIPFCERLCWYCGCNTRAIHRRKTVETYVALLEQEIGLVQGFLAGRLPAQTLHLGGGTPNMIDPEDLIRLVQGLKQTFEFKPDAAISAELDPRVLSREWVQAAAQVGMNRASLGVQDLAPEVQAAVDRIEGFEVIARAVAWLREAGVEALNFDLMYGLPRQTTTGVLATLERVFELRPSRIALFGYAHVPWMKPHQKLISEADLPGPAERLEQNAAAEERLLREGYVAIGLDHFALPEDSLAAAAREGRLRRNFQGYTDDPAASLIGFGVSAISQLREGIAQNLADEVSWRREVAAGRLPVARGVAVTAEDRIRGAVIEQLMCSHGADVARLRARVGDPGTDLGEAFERLEPLRQDGLVEIDGERIAVTEAGRPFLRAACLAFDAYFDPAAQRHSQAV